MSSLTDTLPRVAQRMTEGGRVLALDEALVMVAQIRSEAQAIAELAHPGNRNRLLRDDSIARHADAILALTGDTKEFSDAYMQMSAEESGIASATGDTEEAT